MGRSAKPVVYKGDTFDSLADLAAAFDMSPGTCRARLKKGIPLEAPFGSCKRVIYQGKEWYSVSLLAEAYGLTPLTCTRRLKAGVPLDRPLRKRADIEYQGKRYLDIKALADAYGLAPSTCRKRLKHGTPLDAPVTHGFARPCEYKGVCYDSIEALAWAVKLTHDHARELVDREGKWL